jgi:hypothetical protein
MFRGKRSATDTRFVSCRGNVPFLLEKELPLQMISREKRLSPRRAPRRSLLPLSPKRTQGRLKSLLYRVWLTPESLRAHGRPSGKSAVCGLNGHRAHFIIALSIVTYEQAI